MLSFEPISMDHKPIFQSLSRKNNGRVTECSFTSLYAWAPHFKSSLCIRDDTIYLRTIHRGPHYTLPMGAPDLAAALRYMEEDAQSQSAPFLLRGLTKETRGQVEAVAPGRYHFHANPEQADYLYSVEDLAELPGKKYHSKRNFLARFEKEFASRWSFEDISPDNLDDVWAFQDKWCRRNDCGSNLTLQQESTTIAMLLYNLEKLDAFGALLRVDGAVAAFTVGSLIGLETMDVHAEKADYDIVGSYPMINRAFVRRHRDKINFVNREEDMGLEGLRKAKQSYHPLEVIMKYTARLEK